MRNIVHASMHISNSLMLHYNMHVEYSVIISEIINVIVHFSVCCSNIAVFEVLMLHVNFFLHIYTVYYLHYKFIKIAFTNKSNYLYF